MRNAVKILLAPSLALALMTGCSLQVEPPETPPTYTGSAPPIAEDGYAVYETRRVFDAPLEPLRRYIDEGSRIVANMEETDRIRKPIESVVLFGTWPEVESVRRLEFSDGHFVLERVIENEFPTLFRYQVWNYTSEAGRNLAYAIGEQSWRELPDGRSELTWTYRLMPNAAYKRPFVQRFTNTDMRPLMESALDRLQTEVNAHFQSYERQSEQGAHQ